jgi:hypothetical protein
MERERATRIEAIYWTSFAGSKRAHDSVCARNPPTTLDTERRDACVAGL